MKRIGLAMAAAVVVVAGAASAAHADVIYRENFGNAGTTNASLTTVGWVGYADQTAGDPTGLVQVSNSAGDQRGLANVNAGTSASDTKGFAYGAVGPNGYGPWLAVTSEYQIDPTQYGTLTFTWDQHQADANSSTRLAVQEGGQWYASTTAFVNVLHGAAGSWAADHELHTTTFTMSASDWRPITLVPGTTLALSAGTAASDLSGPITGMGVYGFCATNSALRFDTFEVAGTAPVPEPASLGLLALGGLALLRRR